MLRAVRLLLQCLLFLTPWFLRRQLLRAFFGYRIHPTSRIGLSLIDVGELHVGPLCRIEHFNVVFGLDRLQLDEENVIGKFNWISGLRKNRTTFFPDQPERSSHLLLERGAVMAHRHIIDCSDAVELGEMSALGGWASQIVTHGVDIITNRQRCGPVKIGRAAYVATHVVLLKDSIVPDYCAIGAGSVYRSRNEKPYGLYSGVPAVRVRELDPESLFFHREHSLII
jgi:acetyltransferase-like isoleucine patch superfamily enzyme